MEIDGKIVAKLKDQVDRIKKAAEFLTSYHREKAEEALRILNLTAEIEKKLDELR